MLKEGDKAPNFKSKDQNGDPIRLSDFKGSAGRAFLLSERRHTWLNEGSMFVP
jgi:peroxiredoxin